MGAAFLPVHGAGKVASVGVHPVVVFNACDSYVRRQETQEQVIGTLLGTVRHDGVVEVKNSYAVPHNEQNGQVYVDVEFHRAMIDLHLRVNPAEKIVGGTTGDGVVPTDALIHEFYAHECHNPVHVTLDVTFADRDRLVRAWVGQSLALGSKDTCRNPPGHVAREARRRGRQELPAPTPSTPPPRSTSGRWRWSTRSTPRSAWASRRSRPRTPTSPRRGTISAPPLAQAEGDAGEGVDVRRRRGLRQDEGDAEIGRRLADALSSVPGLTKSQFEKLFGERAQDALLVTYLSNVTKMQLMLAEKLQTASLLI